MSENVAIGLDDIRDRDDLRKIVDAFYEQVREDDLLGFIFDEVAGVDWKTHLPKMVDFWETVLFGAGSYRGNPLGPHLKLSEQTAMESPQFDRWRMRFFQTVDRLFAGLRSEHLKSIADDMAEVMLSRITGEPRGMTSAGGVPRPA